MAGLSMPYHYFVHVHLASASQVTGLELPVIYLRLYTLPLIVLLVLQLVVAGSSLARSAYAGLVAACLVLLVGQMNLNHETALGFVSFLGVLPTYLHSSPSVPFGLVLLVPLLILIGEAISSPWDATRLSDWVLIAVFMVGASNAKVVILPMIVASLFLYGAARLLTHRRLPPAVWIAGALGTAVFAVLYLVLYRGHSSGVALDPAAGVALFNGMIAVGRLKYHLQATLPTFPGSGVLLSSGGIVFGAVGLFSAQLIGLVWLLIHQGLHLNKRQAWLLAFLVTGLVVPLVSNSPGTGNVLYFLAYGTVAGCILAAEGLQLAWRSKPRLDRSAANRSGVLALAGLAILALAITVPARLFSATDVDGLSRSYLWAYAGFALGLLVLLLIAGRWFRHGRWVGAAVATSVLIVAGALDRPIESARGGVRTIEPVEVGRHLSPELYEAMEWIRDNTPEDAVIAVNNADALEFGYAAFSERRSFLGGWAYSLPVRESGYASVELGFMVGGVGSAGSDLFAPRVSLNDRAFQDADPQAISELRDHGVRYLVVDETNGYPADLPALREVARPVYEAPGVTVLELDR